MADQVKLTKAIEIAINGTIGVRGDYPAIAAACYTELAKPGATVAIVGPALVAAGVGAPVLTGPESMTVANAAKPAYDTELAAQNAAQSGAPKWIAGATVFAVILGAVALIWVGMTSGTAGEALAKSTANEGNITTVTKTAGDALAKAGANEASVTALEARNVKADTRMDGIQALLDTHDKTLESLAQVATQNSGRLDDVETNMNQAQTDLADLANRATTTEESLAVLNKYTTSRLKRKCKVGTKGCGADGMKDRKILTPRQARRLARRTMRKELERRAAEMKAKSETKPTASKAEPAKKPVKRATLVLPKAK